MCLSSRWNKAFCSESNPFNNGPQAYKENKLKILWMNFNSKEFPNRLFYCGIRNSSKNTQHQHLELIVPHCRFELNNDSRKLLVVEFLQPSWDLAFRCSPRRFWEIFRALSATLIYIVFHLHISRSPLSFEKQGNKKFYRFCQRSFLCRCCSWVFSSIHVVQERLQRHLVQQHSRRVLKRTSEKSHLQRDSFLSEYQKEADSYFPLSPQQNQFLRIGEFK